ncbi:uncharacterized protein [Aquarana catesbeiana]|uniref:uncharacterized protein isoform X1 n=1 Tax=Aquarana catesbeiana TaxID=8400 RepID=UPI003CC93E9E
MVCEFFLLSSIWFVVVIFWMETISMWLFLCHLFQDRAMYQWGDRIYVSHPDQIMYVIISCFCYTSTGRKVLLFAASDTFQVMSQAADIEDFASIPPSRGSELGSTPSRTWTVPRLMAELQRRGTSYLASARKAELFRLLFPCASGSSAEQVTLWTVASSLSQIHATVSSLVSSCQELRARVEVLEAQPSPVSGLSAGTGTPLVSSPVPIGPGNSMGVPPITPLTSGRTYWRAKMLT